MQIICPNCGARYTVDPVALGPAGRTVQCFRCNHRWFEPVEPAAAVLDEYILEERPVPDFVIRPQTYGSALPAIADQRDFPSWAKVLIGVAVMLGIVAGLVFMFKDDIIPMLPQDLREQLGLPAIVQTAPPATEMGRPQLEVDLTASKVDYVDGRYVVRGEIVNKGRVSGTTRTLKLVFKKDADVLGERAYALIEGPIAPGARRPFSQVLDDPPAGTTDIVPAIE